MRLLSSDECLKPTKVGSDASIATMIGALWLGALIALTEFPKHKSPTPRQRGLTSIPSHSQVITSTDMHRKA